MVGKGSPDKVVSFARRWQDWEDPDAARRAGSCATLQLFGRH